MFPSSLDENSNNLDVCLRPRKYRLGCVTIFFNCKTCLFPTSVLLLWHQHYRDNSCRWRLIFQADGTVVIRVWKMEYMKVLSQFPEHFFMLCYSLKNSKFSHVPKQLWPLKSRSVCQIFHDKDFLCNLSSLFPTARIHSALPLGSAFFGGINTISNKNSV